MPKTRLSPALKGQVCRAKEDQIQNHTFSLQYRQGRWREGHELGETFVAHLDWPFRICNQRASNRYQIKLVAYEPCFEFAEFADLGTFALECVKEVAALQAYGSNRDRWFASKLLA